MVKMEDGIWDMGQGGRWDMGYGKILRSRHLPSTISHRGLAPGTPAQPVVQQVEEKQKIIAQVARGEPAWFGPEPEDPSQSVALHPGGSIGLQAGVDVEGKADGQNDAPPDQGFVTFEPGLLFGGAEADPNKVGREIVDFGDDLFLGKAFELSVQATVAVEGTDELDAGIDLAEPFAQFGAALLGTTEQIVGKRLGRGGQEFAHEGRAIDPVAEAGAGTIQTPDQRHAIGRERIVGAGQVAEPGFVAAHRDDLSIGKLQGDAARATGPLPALGAQAVVIGEQQRCA